MMVYRWIYNTPDGLDDLYMSSDGEYLTGLWFAKSKDTFKHPIQGEEKELPIFQETLSWLDTYFSGKEPDFIPKYKIEGLTAFRQEVMDILNTIPYGKTLTYGDIAERIARDRGMKRMSSQAVGQAVDWNPICIIIPCHRVMGANGKLTGYGGGIENKAALLRHEKKFVEKELMRKEKHGI